MCNVVNFSIFQYSVYMSVCQFVHSSVCLSISLFRQFVHLSICHSSIHQPINSSVYLSICLSEFHPSVICQSVHPYIPLFFPPFFATTFFCYFKHPHFSVDLKFPHFFEYFGIILIFGYLLRSIYPPFCCILFRYSFKRIILANIYGLCQSTNPQSHILYFIIPYFFYLKYFTNNPLFINQYPFRKNLPSVKYTI